MLLKKTIVLRLNYHHRLVWGDKTRGRGRIDVVVHPGRKRFSPTIRITIQIIITIINTTVKRYYYYYYYIMSAANIPTATTDISVYNIIPLPRDERVSRRPGCCAQTAVRTTSHYYGIIMVFCYIRVVAPVFRFRPARTIAADDDRVRADVRVWLFSPAHTHVTHHTSSSSSQSFNTTLSRSFAVVASVAPLVATAKFTRPSTDVHVYIII